jgi:hypothetical protein
VRRFEVSDVTNLLGHLGDRYIYRAFGALDDVGDNLYHPNVCLLRGELVKQTRPAMLEWTNPESA